MRNERGWGAASSVQQPCCWGERRGSAHRPRGDAGQGGSRSGRRRPPRRLRCSGCRPVGGGDTPGQTGRTGRRDAEALTPLRVQPSPRVGSLNLWSNMQPPVRAATTEHSKPGPHQSFAAHPSLTKDLSATKSRPGRCSQGWRRAREPAERRNARARASGRLNPGCSFLLRVDPSQG